jgi:hypothetical protein
VRAIGRRGERPQTTLFRRKVGTAGCMIDHELPSSVGLTTSHFGGAGRELEPRRDKPEVVAEQSDVAQFNGVTRHNRESAPRAMVSSFCRRIASRPRATTPSEPTMTASSSYRAATASASSVLKAS